MAESSSSSPDRELDAVDTMPIGNVLQLLIKEFEDERYVTAAGLVFRERLKMQIRMARARGALHDCLCQSGAQH